MLKKKYVYDKLTEKNDPYRVVQNMKYGKPMAVEGRKVKRFMAEQGYLYV